MEDENDTTCTNPYMALRAAKIARNQARLKELGLYKPSAATRSRKRGPVIERKKKHETAASAAEPRRRSVRISGDLSNPNYVESKDFKKCPPYSSTRQHGTKRSLDVDDNPIHDADERIHLQSKQTSSKPSTSSRQQIAPAANSVRTVSLDVSILVRKFLAKPLETFGKYFIIETSFKEAAYPEDRQRLEGASRLSFNKFSGVQLWKNVIFLWINVGGPTGANSLVNVFSHNGSRVTWFGGSKMREESPVIQALIRMGKETASTPSFSSALILWVRQYDSKKKKLLPYTCLGRLAYESHIPESQPVAFTWRLIDYESMIGNQATRKMFREISGPG